MKPRYAGASSFSTRRWLIWRALILLAECTVAVREGIEVVVKRAAAATHRHTSVDARHCRLGPPPIAQRQLVEQCGISQRLRMLRPLFERGFAVEERVQLD